MLLLLSCFKYSLIVITVYQPRRDFSSKLLRRGAKNRETQHLPIRPAAGPRIGPQRAQDGVISGVCRAQIPRSRPPGRARFCNILGGNGGVICLPLTREVAFAQQMTNGEISCDSRSLPQSRHKCLDSSLITCALQVEGAFWRYPNRERPPKQAVFPLCAFI